jgi:Bacterial Ig domain/Bacterial Ig-like domain
LLWTGDAAPYTMEWDTTGITGTFTLVAEAVDGAGNMTRVSKSFVVDNTPPTVAFTAPAAGATLTGQVQVSATASDAHTGIRFIRYSLENGSMYYALGRLPTTKSIESHAPSYALNANTMLVPNGTYDLVAEVSDRAGNIARTSRPVTVTNLVRVAIKDPTPGQYVAGTMSASADASSTTGLAIARVEFSHNFGPPIIDTTPPYAAAINVQGCWSGTSFYPNYLTVKAVDTAGNSATVGVEVTLRTGRPCPNGGGGGLPTLPGLTGGPLMPE